ncbi:hypothetical protein HHK36_030574 [Tetracentron sinense]|uniref:Protein kinase domain-containing protein n=1 Tax=Tetracentron sinense TaxID=13715 RepID=A0A835D0S9_TETSI|nr:hypothetical protein HHK36_030574 [Tetracentron sinense]
MDLSILAAAASLFVVILICAIIFLICRSRKENHQTRTTTRTIPSPNLSPITVEESTSFDPSLSRISMPELIAATRNFAAEGIIGDGSFGFVYKARLSNGVLVAIKKLGLDAFQGFREFRAEMEILGKLRHRNIVKILGYCVSGADRILIYEFVEKGSLDQWLYDTSSVDESSVSSPSTLRSPLSWETRIKIIREVAMGLSYLHYLESPIIHRDIKASNVLLDSEFEAHIADFGFARRIQGTHSHVSTQVAGTMGYMPPEYKDGATAATVKADVYSFGILMLEVATGKRPNWPMKMESGKEVGLAEWARKMVGQSREIEMVDETVSKDGLREAEVREYFRIACLCSSEKARERPSMSEVVSLLNHLSDSVKSHFLVNQGNNVVIDVL